MSRSVICFVSAVSGLPVRKHPDAALLLQGRGAAPGAQGHFVTFDREVESVAGGEPHFVPEGFGQDDAARSIQGDFARLIVPSTMVASPIREMAFTELTHFAIKHGLVEL